MKLAGTEMLRAMAAGVFMILPAAASADGYINNGNQWQQMTPVERKAYVQGLNDTVNFVYQNDDLPTAVVKVARTRCLIETKTAPNILADIITTAYSKQPQLVREPPLFVYVLRLSDICRTFINQERQRMNLAPLPQPARQQ